MIGSVKVGDFRRGQGGIMCKMSRPYNLKNAPDLFIEAEQRRTLIDLGYNDRWQLDQSNAKYKKPKHLIHSPDELRGSPSSDMMTMKRTGNVILREYADKKHNHSPSAAHLPLKQKSPTGLNLFPQIGYVDQIGDVNKHMMSMK